MAESPAFLSAKDEGSFAYLTIKDRTPQILTKVIDTLHRHKSEFFEKHGEEGIEAEKKAISLLSKLRNELQTDKPITPLVDKCVDTHIWNQYLEYQRSLLNEGDGEPRWFFSPWLFVECYMYRRIHEAIMQSPPIHDFDVFKESKEENFFESQDSIDALCTHLLQLKPVKGLREEQIQDEFFKLLQLRELRSKMLSKEACCQELKAEMESYKESSARKSSLLTSLRGRMEELQEESAAVSASKSRAEASVHAMMKENQELMKKVLELDEKLQNSSKENEESKKQGSEYLRRHEEFRAQLHDCLSLDKKHEETSDEDLILKLRELYKEPTFLKGQLTTLEETVTVHEMEAKANRETIRRLAAEVSREQTKAASWAEEKDKLNQDLLSAVEGRTALEREVKLYQERLLASQRAWDASKQELTQLRKRCQELDVSLKASREAATASQSRNSCFREKLAALLCSRFDTAESTEDAILERIRELGIEEESQRRMTSQLEAQISEFVGKLGNESESHQKALQRAHVAEKKLEALQGQLSHLEGELLSGDVVRDNLFLEKQKYLKFLDQLTEKMKLGHVAADLGFDMCLDVVLARIEQLVRLESNAVIENKTMAHNLQRKLKTQKERLESKEVHMNLLRQKIAQLQQEKEARSALAVERDEAHLAVRKLEKKLERMQKELSACQEHNTELKAKLADTNELKIKTLEQTKAIEDLNQSRDELEKMKENAEKKLMLVMSELENTEQEVRAHQERSRAMIELASLELKTLRKSLDEAERKGQQLADFREVVSSMLGLNMTSHDPPDYEIIKCLERLLHSHRHHHHHHHFVPCACLQDMAAEQGSCSHCRVEIPH